LNARSIVLTGFMGTGKTAVGRAVAERLGREFVDMDAVIETREGQSVRAIFETRGEACFRAIESALCAELGAREGLVIATGGGALINPGNRACFADALIVCLDATVDEILARVGHMRDRPLLAGDPRERIEALLAARQKAYAEIPLHVDTTGHSVQQVAEQVIALYEAQQREHRLNVTTPEGAYPIRVGPGLLARLGAILRELSPGERFSSRCALITNPCVGEWYTERTVESLRAAGFEPCIIQIPDGERFKTLDTVCQVYDQLIEAQLDRRSMILALGGGVIGDLAGFAAATFLRGVPLVQLPTTLLAMVDASLGGKVAVDHPRGKNLIGAFKQPQAVVADVDTLDTLPNKEWRSGMAEVIKHGIIGDAGLFEMLEEGRKSEIRNRKSEIGGWIKRAIRVKVEIVTRDPFERNERVKLNLGHTFGHALEKLSDYEMRHGDAVAIGMMCAARLAVRLGMCDSDLVARLERLLSATGLPTRVPGALPAEAILDAMGTDKKREDGQLRFVLPRALGDVTVVDGVAREQVMEAIEDNR